MRSPSKRSKVISLALVLIKASSSAPYKVILEPVKVISPAAISIDPVTSAEETLPPLIKIEAEHVRLISSRPVNEEE